MHKAPQFILSKTLALQPLINLKPNYFELLYFIAKTFHTHQKLEKTGRNCGRFDAWVIPLLKY